MSLKDLDIKIHYRTNKDSVVKELIIPSLKQALIYSRAVGYFTIDAILNYAEGLIGLLNNNGKMQLIISPMLTEADVETIKSGYEITESTVIERLIVQLRDVNNLMDSAKLDIIANLIAINKLEIRVAYCPDGIYHEKIGVIEDSDGYFISFQGSMNETYSALFRNVESISVYKSWIEGASDYAKEISLSFGELWNNRSDNVNIVNFPEALKEHFINKYKTSADLEAAVNNYEKIQNSEGEIKDNEFKYQKTRSLYEYQIKAINEFISNGYRHFFEMATGTGKTFTAVNALKKLMDDMLKVFIIILVPQIDLQSQWMYELKQAGIENVYGIGGGVDSSNWEYDFSSSLIDYNADNKSVVYVAVYDSFFSKLVSKTNKVQNLAIVVDEAHNLSTNQMLKMPRNAAYRLGLSATPEKHNIDETTSILEYFIGKEKETFKYTIEEAIENKFLSRYKYYPIFVELYEEEFDDYVVKSKRIAMLQSQEIKDFEAINTAMNDRSLIIKKAMRKTMQLKKLIKEGYNFRNSVIYCGQGKIGDTEEKMIDAVTKILNEDGRYCVSTFTSKTPNRKLVLDEFRKGFFDTLVAIKCFDEGVDVPQLDKIYIMSSDRLIRQTIQRRGRVLRICKESDKDIAYIYDMVILPPNGVEDKLAAKSLVRNEFFRVKEYMRLAENKNDFETEIMRIEEFYSIDEEDYKIEKELD